MSAGQFVCKEPFWPETIQVMSLAFEQVCADLGLKVQDDPATRMVAAKIMFLAQRGTKDVETLHDLTLREFGKMPSR